VKRGDIMDGNVNSWICFHLYERDPPFGLGLGFKIPTKSWLGSNWTQVQVNTILVGLG